MANRNFRMPRRKTEWAGLGDSTGTGASLALSSTISASQVNVITGAATVSRVADPISAGLTAQEFTITRTILDLDFGIIAGAALNQMTVSVGLGVFRGEAFLAGGASLADPAERPDFEWLYWSRFNLRTSDDTQDPFNFPMAGIHIHEDLKGQRIVHNGELVAMIVTTSGTAGVSTAASTQARFLVKLP